MTVNITIDHFHTHVWALGNEFSYNYNSKMPGVVGFYIKLYRVYDYQYLNFWAFSQYILYFGISPKNKRLTATRLSQ